MKMKVWPLRLPVLAAICWCSIGAAYFLAPSPYPNLLLPYPVGSGGNLQFFEGIHITGAVVWLLRAASVLSAAGIVLALSQAYRVRSSGAWRLAFWVVVFMGTLLFSAYLLLPGVLLRAVE